MEEIATNVADNGRPKAKPKKRRGPRRSYSCRFPVRLKGDEIEILKAKAKRAGMSLSRFVVHSALAERAITPEQRHDIERRFGLLQSAIEEVSRVGNNLNQIAHQLNAQTGTISSHAIHQALVSVVEALNDLRVLWTKGEDY